MTCLSGIQPACLEDCRKKLLTRGCLTAFLPLAQVQSHMSTAPLLSVTSHHSYHELHRHKKNLDSLEVFTQLLQTLTPCAEALWREGREETREETSLFLPLVLGIWVTTKHLVLFCLLSRSAACFTEPWKHASNTAHTGKNWPEEVAGGGEELDSFNSICVLHTAWTVFVHVTQYTSNTQQITATLVKIKTDKLKICRIIYVSPLISACF